MVVYCGKDAVGVPDWDMGGVMRKKIYILAILLSVVLAGCGSPRSAASADSGAYVSKSKGAEGFGYAAEAPAPAADTAAEDYYEEAAEAPESEAGGENVVLNEGEAGNSVKSSRKLITTADISTETDDVEVFVSNTEKKIEALGGYVESSSIYNSSDYYRDSYKSADITARVPSDKFKEFMNDVEGSSNVTSRSINTRDVTLEYTDTEAQERALSAEQKSLENMMAHAETMEDIIAIQSQLTDVRYRLDSIRSQLRVYDNDISYSKVYISVTETSEFTVTEEETAWDRIRNGFVDNLLSVMEAVTEFVIWILTHIPVLVLLGIIILVLIIVIRRIIKADNKRRAAKAAGKTNGKEKPEKKGETVIMNEEKKTDTSVNNDRNE